MNSVPAPIAAYRRLWVPELATLVALAVSTFAAFAWSDLDVATAGWFFRPGRADPWPLAQQPLWALFYGSAPWVTGSLAATGGVLLLCGVIRPARRLWRLHGLLILLCVAIGPGLIVNGILKDHWGRPRPRQIIEFGGRLEYTPPLVPADTPGKSFPCGHCSVGYLYGLGWWLWRRSHPRWAAASLAVGVVVGTLLGLGRMAAGGHFLSDAVWAGLIAFGVAHILYYHVLRIPAREDSATGGFHPLVERHPRLRAAAIAATFSVWLWRSLNLAGKRLELYK